MFVIGCCFRIKAEVSSVHFFAVRASLVLYVAFVWHSLLIFSWCREQAVFRDCSIPLSMCPHLYFPILSALF